MKEILYNLAQQITKNEISEDEAIAKLKSTSIESLNWEEFLSELPAKSDNIKYSNHLLNLLQKATESLEIEERLSKLESVYNLLKNTKIYKGVASLATVIGNTHREMGHLEKAIPYYETSRKLLKILDTEVVKEEEDEILDAQDISSQEISDELMIDEASTLEASPVPNVQSPISQMALPSIQPSALKAGGEWKQIEDILEKARQNKDVVQECNALLEMGKYYHIHGNLDKAGNVWHESLALAKKIFYVEGMAKCYKCMGEIALEQREVEEAQSLFVLGIEALEQIRYILPVIDNLDEYFPIFENMIALFLGKNDAKKAFFYVEYAKRWQTLVRLDERKTILAAKVAKNIQSEYIQLLEQNFEFYNALLKNNPGKQNKDLLKQNKTRLNELRNQIYLEDNDWGRKFGQKFDFNCENLQEKLSNATMLLEFFVTSKGTYLFFLSRKVLDALLVPELSAQYLTKLYEPLTEAQRFLKLWSTWCVEKSHGTQETFQGVNAKLNSYTWKNAHEAQNFWKIQMGIATKKIAEIILPELINHTEYHSITKLIFVSDGVLQLFPLHLLQIEGSDFQIYLQDRYEIIYSPTAYCFYDSLDKTVSQKNKLLIAHFTQQNVPFMREEIRIMNHIWPGELIFQLGGNTTFDKFEENFHSVSHIHLAVHTQNAQSKNANIHFADSPVSPGDIISHIPSGNIETMTLSANEYNVDLNHSSDLSLLFWALHRVGVKNIVAPMWFVPDIVIFFVVEKFYNGLGQGLSPTMALQEAQNEIRSMTIADVIERLQQQQRLANSDIPWIENICQFLLNERPISFDEKKMALAVLQGTRNVIQFQGKPIKVNLSDFILEVNGAIPGEEELLDKSFRPFAHPFYWGAFFCSGIGLTELYFVEEENVEEFYQMPEDNDVDEAEIVSESEIIASEKQEELQPIEVQNNKSPFDKIKIRATCPHCGTNIHCFLPMANKSAKCPQCKLKVKIPKREVLLTEIAAGDPHTSVLLING